MAIAQNSRNTLTSIVRVTDPVTGRLTKPEFVDLRQRVSAFSPNDRFITVDSSMTWGNLGLNQLGDARSWWVVADLSNVIDPFLELTPGSSLRCPTQHRYLFDILAPEQTKT